MSECRIGSGNLGAAGIIATYQATLLASVYYLQCGAFAALLQGGCNPWFPSALRRLLFWTVPLFTWMSAPAALLMPSFERFEHLPGPHWVVELVPATLLVALTTAFWTPFFGSAFVSGARLRGILHRTILCRLTWGAGSHQTSAVLPYVESDTPPE